MFPLTSTDHRHHHHPAHSTGPSMLEAVATQRPVPQQFQELRLTGHTCAVKESPLPKKGLALCLQSPAADLKALGSPCPRRVTLFIWGPWGHAGQTHNVIDGRHLGLHGISRRLRAAIQEVGQLYMTSPQLKPWTPRDHAPSKGSRKYRFSLLMAPSIPWLVFTSL